MDPATIAAGVAAVAALATLIFGRLDGRFKEIKTEIGAVEGRLKEEVGAVEGRLREEIGAVEGRLREEIGAVENRLVTRIDRVGERIDRGDDRLEQQIAEVRRPLMWQTGDAPRRRPEASEVGSP